MKIPNFFSEREDHEHELMSIFYLFFYFLQAAINSQAVTDLMAAAEL